MICFITVVACISIVIKADNIYCTASYECAGEFISNSGDGNIFSLGYKANYGATSTIYLTGARSQAEICGAFGAYQIGTLYNTNNFFYLLVL